MTGDQDRNLNGINFVETKHMIEAWKSLIRMINFLDNSNKVKTYLLEQCNYLLNPLTGNTGIQILNNLPKTQIIFSFFTIKWKG